MENLPTISLNILVDIFNVSKGFHIYVKNNSLNYCVPQGKYSFLLFHPLVGSKAISLFTKDRTVDVTIDFFSIHCL